MLIKSKGFVPKSEECRISEQDLARLPQVKELLSLLNDPYIGPYKLTECVEALPVLAARCRRAASLVRPRSEVQPIERALNVLGNRGLETVLLEFLEDMTVLRCELEAGRQPSARSENPSSGKSASKP